MGTTNPGVARKGTEALRRAINSFFDNHPLLAFAIARVRQVPDFGIDTIGINDEELRYNPAFIAERTPLDNNFIVIHEAAHTFLGHHVRFASLKLEFEGRYNRTLTDTEWRSLHVLCNVAADLALHGLITKMPKVPTPSEWLKSFGCFAGRGKFAQLPEGKSMEHYFWALYQDELNKQQNENKQNQQGKDDSKQSGGSNQTTGGDSSDGAEDGGEAGDAGAGEGDSELRSGRGAGAGDGEGDGQGGLRDDDRVGAATPNGAGGLDSSGGCEGAFAEVEFGVGDSSAGRDQPTGLEAIAKGELVANHNPSPGEIAPAKADTQEELDEVEREYEETLAQAVVTAKAQGDLPGWLSSVYEETFGPAGVNWKVLLRRFLDKVCREGRSYAKPNRRTAWRKDIILPARLGRTSGLGVVIIDTSGSMGNAECLEGLKAISDIVRNLPGEVKVEMLQIDTSCAKRAVYTRNDLPLAAEFKGRGGTNLAPGFDEVRRRRHEVRWCICVTDGMWSYQYIEDTGVPTFWLFTQDIGNPPQFGQSIKITVR